MKYLFITVFLFSLPALGVAEGKRTDKLYDGLKNNGFEIHKSVFGHVSIPTEKALDFQEIDTFAFDGERRQGRSGLTGGSTDLGPLESEVARCVAMEATSTGYGLKNAENISRCFSKLMYMKFKWTNKVLNNLYKNRTDKKVYLRAGSQRRIEARGFRLNSNLEDVFLATIDDLLRNRYLMTQDFSQDTTENAIERNNVLMNYAKVRYLYVKNKELFNLGVFTAQKKSFIKEKKKEGKVFNLLVPMIRNTLSILEVTKKSIRGVDVLPEEIKNKSLKELSMMLEDLEILKQK